MNATQYTPAQLDALRKSFINTITTTAPEGVNIKAAVERDGLINLYILNAPAELYDWSAWSDAPTAARCVLVDWKIVEASPALRAIWDHLTKEAASWSKANGGAVLRTSVYIGSPSRSFVPVAKNTPAPHQKPAAVEGVTIPRSISPRDAAILRAMWAEVLAVLADYRTSEEKHTRPALERLAELRHASAVWFTGDNTPRAYNFDGFAVTCAPADLPVLFARYCKAFRVRYAAPALTIEAEAAPSPVVEAAPVVENNPAEVEAEPSPVVEAAPVEVNAAPVAARRRRSFGCMVARLLAAVLLVVIAALRVVVCALRLIERGRLAEVVRVAVVAKVAAVRGCINTQKAAALRRVQGLRLRLLYCVEVNKEKAARRVAGVVEAVRLRVVAVGAGARAAIVAARSIVGGCYCCACGYAGGVARRVCAGAVQAVSVAALSLVIIARRLDLLANKLETI